MRSQSLIGVRPLLVQGHAPTGAIRPRTSRPRTSIPAPSTNFIGRAAVTQGVLRTIQRPGHAGAVVVGAAGIGKTAVLQHIQRALPDASIIRVRGMQNSASFPYRALSFLLSELPMDVTEHPPLVFHAVSALLKEEAGGRRVVLAVDNAEYLDQESASLIGQLVASGRARVVMTVTDFAHADPVFMAMWRHGSLERFELLAFTFDETRQFIETELGAPVSREAVEKLWSLGGGNLQLTRAAMRGLVQRGVLSRRGEAWVLLPWRSVPGAGVINGSSSLRCLSGDQRRIVNLLALTGPIAWADLIQAAEAEDLDRLQDAGVLVVRSESETVVSFAQPGFPDSVTETITKEEAAALYNRVATLPDARRRLEADAARHVGWRMKAGLAVTEEDAVRAASALNTTGDYTGVLDLVQRLQDSTPSARLAYEGLLAALGAGNLTAATTYAARLRAAERTLDPELWTKYKISESRYRRMRAMGDPAEPLREIAVRLKALAGGRHGKVADHQPDLMRLHRMLVAATADLASFNGQYRTNLSTLPAYVDMNLLDSSSREDREFQVAVQSLLLEAQAAVNRQFAAADLAESLAHSLMHLDVSYPIADQALLRVEIAFLVAGGWSDGARLLAEVSRSSGRWSFRLGSLAQLSEGMVLLAQDRHRDAVRLLVSVVEQLRIADPHGLLPIAAAALTYCHSQSSDIGQMITHLPLSEPGRSSSWFIRRAASHFQLMATTGIESRSDAARRFHERAHDDLSIGASMWALVALSSAVRLGRHEAVDDLARVARELEGPLAAICMSYAEGLATGAMHLLVDAMEGAVATGNHRFAMDIAQSGIKAATRAEDKAGLRLVQRRLRELVPDSSYFAASGGNLDLLTPREREVAALAAGGTSNRGIAEILFVSVRTVEGHLYQVYSKLNVGTRAELAEIVPMESAP